MKYEVQDELTIALPVVAIAFSLAPVPAINPWCRIGLGMEILLNLVWALLSGVIVCLWLRAETRTGADRRMPFVALIMLIVILFPVISVSDDLWSIQNPAETDTYQRRNHLASAPHSILPAVAASPELAFAGLLMAFQRCSAPLNQPLLALDKPIFGTIQNRPPPTA